LSPRGPGRVGDNARHPLKLDLKRQKYPAVHAPALAELRRADPDAGTVAEFIDFVEDIDHIEAQMELAPVRQLELMFEED